ncbi:hypothetical protein DFH08DRAFT_974902 [Mycena albidolilacea]|uniref:Uncharacterized protein n=1 Tax=Mycena albidolilacea TaxID=1033008 RepID=A0AAD6Z5Q8_9AGAR|nr:hypothetical protein DFH08DRAFT_974902 [Mycena albidolilacea]
MPGSDVPQSWLRAAAWVAEAQKERARTHHADFTKVVKQWADSGWSVVSPKEVEKALSRNNALLAARTAFLQYLPPRFGKILRARFRHHARLKFLYELDHPPFRRPDLPDELGTLDTLHIYLHILQFFYELEHPPFSHPEFPEDPSFAFWRHGSEITGTMDTRGLNAWNITGGGTLHPTSLLSVNDDENSPTLHSQSLPPV